jgi:RHH-type proline utilization regulon transcriptional repressor/proline dehydrogenase/delta 1-pyrroline-5-carboxylate dehydrogenase
VVAATLRAVQLLGRQFVLGQSMAEAMRHADTARQAQSQGLRFSYDMLGEGARTDADALRYWQSYGDAISALAQAAVPGRGPQGNDGISIKLSALHPRYEDGQSARVMAELLPRVWSLCEQAARADINLTIDAEEVERLELSLEVFDALLQRVAQHWPQWRGLGLALQAYQSRALELVHTVVAMARQHGVGLMCRLVKGAYWDAEIKRAQELGLPHYPVFTHKHHTDISYLACAGALLDAADVIYPQFATHNAATIAAIMQMGARSGGAFELQRLHGMGEGVYREVLKNPLMACRVYAPVGAHKDLLAYLVRRLLENGANSSFVHQLADPHLSVRDLLISPLRLEPMGALPLPPQLFGSGESARANSAGLDFTVPALRAPYLHALAQPLPAALAQATMQDVQNAMQRAAAAFQTWARTSVEQRSAALLRAADSLEQHSPALCALLVREAHKTWGDAQSEVREAVDFLRYYAHEALRIMQPLSMPVANVHTWASAASAAPTLDAHWQPGVTGETNTLQLCGRGVWVCISPWNFPLAICVGQIAAALATGNTVLAKPAEQTPLIAAQALRLLHAAGIPQDALQLLHGPGETVGAALVAQPGVAGVVFTGSTEVAKIIQRALAAKPGPIVPLIAETGGINAMVVDSSALPEQVVDAVISSAFRSAGQRCSALRVLCVHADIADTVLEMLHGAAQELRVGDPADLATDLGPVIDAQAAATLQAHIARLHARHRCLFGPAWQVALAQDGCALPNRIAPHAYEVQSVAEVDAEIFGPVLQVLRWQGDPLDTIAQINALGYGLTLGIQTRIDSRAQAMAQAAHIGNVYINRNMIGAVVGVQAFGGEGLSGTGPKAGGPHYLYRFCAERTVTVNTTAAGGNVALLA